MCLIRRSTLWLEQRDQESPPKGTSLPGPMVRECYSGWEGDPEEVKEVRGRWIDQVPWSPSR
jgi:hypothetical protein